MGDASKRMIFCPQRTSERRAGFLVALFLLLGWSVAWRSVEAQEKSLLWSVGKAQSRIFLLGSIHYLRADNYPLHPSILEAFQKSRELILEIDLNNPKGAAGQKLALQKALYRDGSTLSQNISAETYQLASRRAAELGLDMKILSPMKPWFVALTMLAVNLQRMGFEPRFGVDRYLAAQAQQAGKPTSGLETLEFQLGLFDELSKAEQESLLRETVSEIERLEKSMKNIVQAWLQGEGERLAELLLAGMKEYPQLHEKLIVARNRRWVPQIEKLIEQGGGALVVVGAAHVVGKDGVVEMLKAKGYAVEQR